MAYEGFRDINDQSMIRLTQTFDCMHEVNKPVSDQYNSSWQVSCERHNFCKHEYKMLDVVHTEEINPLPLPIEKPFANTYIYENFKQRHIGTKNRLIIDG